MKRRQTSSIRCNSATFSSTVSTALLTKDGREVPIEDSEDDNGEVVVREFADWKPNPEQQFARVELERILQGAANSLSPGFRTVFYLRDVEGLSTEETAEMLNLTVGAVKARLFRARLRLREELSKIFKRG